MRPARGVPPIAAASWRATVRPAPSDRRRKIRPTACPRTRPPGQNRLAAERDSVVNDGLMPLHAYAPDSPPCRLCGDGFEHLAPAAAAELVACPTCGQAVHRLARQAVNSPKLSAPLSVSRARQAGFTVLKRTSGGEFEKQ